MPIRLTAQHREILDHLGFFEPSKDDINCLAKLVGDVIMHEKCRLGLNSEPKGVRTALWAGYRHLKSMLREAGYCRIDVELQARQTNSGTAIDVMWTAKPAEHAAASIAPE